MHTQSWSVRRGPLHLLALMTLVLGMVAGLVPAPAQALALNPPVVISQVYGGGGNSGATYTHDFIELLNRSGAPTSLAGWSLQYASATGTGTFGASATQLTELPAVTLQPGQYLLVQEAQGTGGTTPLPTPDVVDPTPIALSATGGKVALINSTTPLGCNGSSTPCPPAAIATIVDLVGYGAATFFEGAGPTAAPGNTTAVLRLVGGCTDTNANLADFSVDAPTPRATGAPLNPCVTVPNAPLVASCPVSVSAVTGALATAPVTATDPDGRVANASITSAPVSGISLDAVAPAAAVGGALTATLAIGATTPAGSYAVAITYANVDPSPQTATCTVTVLVGTVARIRDIQGAAHVSPLLGQVAVQVPGIVTGVRNNGFYLQDDAPDANPATSEGLFVFTSSAPGRAVGERLSVSGTVSEFRPGGGGSTNLSLTQLSGRLGIVVVATNQVLPPPVVIGVGGRVPPAQIIDNDTSGSVEVPAQTTFDPEQDGIDFYESLESMRVQVNNPVTVGPTIRFGGAQPAACATPGNNCEIVILPDNGAGFGQRTARGGIIIRPGDFNPERLILNNILDRGAPLAMPNVNVGDRLDGAVVGLLDYDFGNFRLQPSQPLPPVISAGLARETSAFASLAGNQFTVGAFNVENLSPTDDPAKFAALATTIVTNLKAPDILALEEIQDNSGATNDGVVAADQTYRLLIEAIVAAGGPAYQYRQIDPENNQDGGQPGGNIRVGFLFRADRGLTFVDRGAAGPTTANSVENIGGAPRLQYSPGRLLDPANVAFTASRKPLAGEFTVNGRRLFVIANHFNSKGGDQPLGGRFQPPTLTSEAQRLQQATIVATFVGALLAIDPKANVVVLGDLNDFEFSPPLTILENAGLTSLIETLPANERYTYNFQGNAQTLDHILVSANLRARFRAAVDVVHVNSEFFDQQSDHDPSLARLTYPKARLFVNLRPSEHWINQGDEVTFTITYATSEPTRLTLMARVPTGVQFVGATAGGSHAAGTVTWDLGLVSPGVGRVEFTVKALTPGLIVSAATLTDPDGTTTDRAVVLVTRRGAH